MSERTPLGTPGRIVSVPVIACANCTTERFLLPPFPATATEEAVLLGWKRKAGGWWCPDCIGKLAVPS